MLLLNKPPRHLFFTGKGGVGKTSIACATAVHLADSGKRVLLVSTDPASNIGHALETQIGSTPTPIRSVANLDAIDINPQVAAQAYRERILAPVRSFLPQREIDAITEQLSGSCTTEIASFNEFTSLLAGDESTEQYDHIIFDTAPTGHTIRLLQLPGDWSNYLDVGKGDTSCLGPMSGLDKHRSTYRQALQALKDPQQTRIVLVARAQQPTIDEVERTFHELKALDIEPSNLIINAVLPDPSCDPESQNDPLYRDIFRSEQGVLNSLPDVLNKLDMDVLPLQEQNMIGVDMLRELLAHGTAPHCVPQEAVTTLHDAATSPEDAAISRDDGTTPPSNLSRSTLSQSPQLQESLSTLIDELEPNQHGLVITMGKGGVGKTTLASAIALALAQRGHEVLLSTTDPAAHIDAAVSSDLPNLSVRAIDPHEATERYRRDVLETKGAHLDAAGKAALEEDLRSPCTEEIAVFNEFSDVVKLAETQFVVLDTAPTGHTLLLVDATGSYHREITRQAGKTTDSEATALTRLQNPDLTRVIIVTLPERTPILEAQQLVEDLARAQIYPWAWAVNNSLSAANPRSPLLMQRAEAETQAIASVQAQSERCVVISSLQPTA
ncbi:TRC40/GET3/ArsA family transport-energizing ATPase [Arcanobacterium bovis]|uniref:TRC40/GET3/ArsA family transport-energizing ATPase n=1 Tax=Arcanobacterium bovis TaxID=2529275 RepID=UPI001F4FE8DF|nr:TRC40/GET3/ArsA family transport-energizing ATPase [Arcanobacterium bovis]